MKILIRALFTLMLITTIACGIGGQATGSNSAEQESGQITENPIKPGGTAPDPSDDNAASASKIHDENNRGGTFRRIWADPPTLDPSLVTDTTSAGVVVEIFSGLVAFNSDLDLIPDIAESWDVSSDGQSYTFYLRTDAKFHDGKPVTAQDFKWAIERSANPDTGSPVADTYLNDIIGIEL